MILLRLQMRLQQASINGRMQPQNTATTPHPSDENNGFMLSFGARWCCGEYDVAALNTLMSLGECKDVCADEKRMRPSSATSALLSSSLFATYSDQPMVSTVQ